MSFQNGVAFSAVLQNPRTNNPYVDFYRVARSTRAGAPTGVHQDSVFCRIDSYRLFLP